MGTGVVFLLAGGRGGFARRPDAALAEAVRGTGKARPSIAYVGAASEDSYAFRLVIGRWLKGAGAGAVLPVKLCGRKPDLAGARALLDGADAVFVSGGDVERGMEILGQTGMSAHLRLLAGQGKAFIGVSAGSIMLAKYWIRWADPNDDASAELYPCLGIAAICCDTHDEDAGWPELKSLVALLPEGGEAWGIPSGGLLIVRGDGSVKWAGLAPAIIRRRAGGPVALSAPDSAGA